MHQLDMTDEIKLNQILDQLLLDMESADFNNAIFTLLGILDGALLFGNNHTALCRILYAHSISDFIMAGSTDDGDEKFSSTLVKLQQCISKFPYKRAIIQRWKLSATSIENMLQYQNKALIIGDIGMQALALLQTVKPADLLYLSGHLVDKQNISEVNRFDGRFIYCPNFSDDALFDVLLHSSLRFDKIIAPTIGDTQNSNILAIKVDKLAALLNPASTLILSAFLPHHIGVGWRSVFENQFFHTHTASCIAKIAAQSHLSISQFSDASGSLIWTELKSADEHNKKGVYHV